MPGARCTRSLVCSVLVAHECSYRRFTGITRHSRTRMVLTGYAVLSPATNSSCRRHRRIEGFAEPGWVQKTSADLTPATGARTTRFCRPRAACAKVFDGFGTHPPKFGEGGFSIVRLRAAWGSQVLRPALPAPCAPDAAASTASHPNVRDDGQRPS